MTALTTFVDAMTALVSRTQHEPTLLAEGRRHLAALLADDTWLPDSHAQPRPDRYAQYPLHRDAQGRFSDRSRRTRSGPRGWFLGLGSLRRCCGWSRHLSDR